MKRAVIYGAGNIGRGFIGQLLSESGYEVVFIDINSDIVSKMNKDRCYPVTIVSEREIKDIIVNNVRAVNATDIRSIEAEIMEANIMATAVGVNVLPKIASPIAQGLKNRWRNGNTNPLNIIICENLIDANHYLKKLISDRLNRVDKEYLEERVGFVEASIGRMVPQINPDMQDGNVLRICVEEYCELPVDKDGFKGDIPAIKNMIPFSPFKYYIERKLFIHNMGHAITAYLGYLKSCNYIWEAIGDDDIREISRAAMMESARALSKEHGVDLINIQEHIDDLINRFGNRQLGDTIERVGRDLQRKLSPNDRLIGALNLCIRNDIEAKAITMGIAAALLFKDPVKNAVSILIDANKVEEVMEKVCRLAKGTKEWNSIINNIEMLRRTKSLFFT